MLFVVSFFFYGYGDHRDLHVLTHSFPTRRSDDLEAHGGTATRGALDGHREGIGLEVRDCARQPRTPGERRNLAFDDARAQSRVEIQLPRPPGGNAVDRKTHV